MSSARDQPLKSGYGGRLVWVRIKTQSGNGNGILSNEQQARPFRRETTALIPENTNAAAVSIIKDDGPGCSPVYPSLIAVSPGSKVQGGRKHGNRLALVRLWLQLCHFCKLFVCCHQLAGTKGIDRHAC